MALLVCLTPSAAFAQRELHWDRLAVTAHLDAEGRLTVTEAQTMVFTGDWNGGERVFNVRRLQEFRFDGISRVGPGGEHDLSNDYSLDDVDDYAMMSDNTLRWRSRLPTDPPFASTRLEYVIRYALSNILQKDGETYVLDHDFAFSDRDGAITRFELHLTFDPEWQPLGTVPPVYTAGPIAPGRSFELDIPLRYTGTGVPAAVDTARAPEIVRAVWVLIIATAVAMIVFFVREYRHGRFAPLTSAVDETWLRAHVLRHPAEVVAAAWDEVVGSAEVVSLIARMTADGKLSSSVGRGTGKNASMTLRLKVDRNTLSGHERVLVDKLFFNNRTETSTSVVKQHYRKKGFQPATEIEPELKKAVDDMLPSGELPRRWLRVFQLVFVGGVIAMFVPWFQGYPAGFLVLAAVLVLCGAAAACGISFRGSLQWGPRAALLCLIPALLITASTVGYLWFYAGAHYVEMQPRSVDALLAVALAGMAIAVSSLASRRSRESMVFRKHLTAGRAFFVEELRKPQPALRDEWYPWLLAFDLGPQVDTWTTNYAPDTSRTRSSSTLSTSSSSSSSSDSGSSWTGFTGGRSGGAGGGAAWQAAASGMAAGVAPPASSGSSSSSGGSSSSSSSSSGGGGGGGW